MVDVQVEACGKMMRYCRQGVGHLPVLLHISLVRPVVLKLVAGQTVPVCLDLVQLASEHKAQQLSIHDLKNK